MISFSRKELKTLFDGKKVSAILPYNDFDAESGTIKLIQEGNGRLSISGAQEKYAFVEDNGILRLTKAGESGRFIVKPIPSERRFFYKDDMPANEHLTMTIADDIYDLEVAAHGLCWLGNGQPAYITRRFDYRPDGSKYAMEDLASVAELNSRNGSDFKYSALSYEECADLINQYCSAPVADLLVFFKILVFNYLLSNADAHLKNFSLIEREPGEYHLSPAYDLLNTSLHISTPIFALDKGLFREGRPIRDTTPIGRPMFIEFGQRIGLPEIIVLQVIDFFAGNTEKVEKLIFESFLSEEAKESYLSQFHYRQSTLR